MFKDVIAKLDKDTYGPLLTQMAQDKNIHKPFLASFFREIKGVEPVEKFVASIANNGNGGLDVARGCEILLVLLLMVDKRPMDGISWVTDEFITEQSALMIKYQDSYNTRTLNYVNLYNPGFFKVVEQLFIRNIRVYGGLIIMLELLFRAEDSFYENEA